MSTTEQESRQVAEQARETEWEGRTFLRELFLGTLLLGCLLGLAAERASSLLAAVLMHLSNNGLAFLAGDFLSPRLLHPGPSMHLLLLGTAAFGLLSGLRLLHR